MPRELSAVGRRQVGDEPQSCRRHVRRQARAARGEDLALRGRIRHSPVAQHHFGEDEGAGNRALTREHAARTHGRVRVERRLDRFRVNLGAADVDNPAAPADKIEPVTAPLDDIASVDEAVITS